MFHPYKLLMTAFKINATSFSFFAVSSRFPVVLPDVKRLPASLKIC